MRLSTKNIVVGGMITAVISVLSILTIPMPSGVPVTLQTFAIALCGYVLGWRRGIVSTGIYLLLGAVGVPVFAGMTGGPSVLFGHLGGFLWGFLFLTLLCGTENKKQNCCLNMCLGASRNVFRKMKKTALRIGVGIVGLAICHFFGVFQFAIVMNTTLKEAFLLASLPYIAKDVISVAGAYFVSVSVKRAIMVR